ncbi:MAG: hypothetical protein J4472_01375 [DPANN group archaeon]|nr:hypothetical protein [DPANN group archaeon]
MLTNKYTNKTITNYSNLQKVIDELKSISGLTKILLLTNLDKLEFKVLEDSNNWGVKLALERRYVFVVVHDSNFRQPMGSMVLQDNNSSPSAVLHKHIINRFDLDLTNEDATLIIGFDL